MPVEWDETADVCVVGSGGAALTAAYTAAANGARTLVLEKTGYFGGTSAYSGSCLWLPGNHVLRRAGVEDSVARGLEYFRAVVGDRTPAALQEAYVSTAPELVEFLDRDPVLEFEFLPFPDYFTAPGHAPGGRGIVPKPLPAAELGDRLGQVRPPVSVDQYGVAQDRETLTGGQALIGRLLLALDRTGNATMRTGTRMRSLVVEDGRVAGVEVEHEGRTLFVRAERGVILAAGGFERDAELRRELQGLPGADWSSAAPGSNTGDALAALRAAGAAIDLTDESWWCPAVLFPNGHAAFTLGLRGGVFVNAAGERFANESLPYDRMGHEIRAGHATGVSHLPVWWIFDARFTSTPGITQPAPDPGTFQAAGLWRTAGTLTGLAELIGVPADVLGKTVTRFNGFAASGVDADFHRGEAPYDRFFAAGDGPNPSLVPIDRAPFHAVQVVLGDLGTKGGARIGVDAQVLGEDGAAIPGLYAVGNSAASVAGHVYPGPGVPLGSGMTFGYRAVNRILAETR
ncbi:3-oxosteroid 1-dehydrogenase [Sphaerisporangium krabiense]|uniref:3-oxosteroid 1-dehydrogenase n=1 Tax=Sphaerisporangium krabiense TaxID=763782 RepID=A0A7W9DN91_9ACTN|nr:FAD-dependent oxidoreductase [Sphaerisporangium krabiense]MBB5625176.1 succinate dehydrogenase/fumarate reductase flavoprotein subunit [Sphaerisporangium krabiense]GII64316.1 3-oxosteroid 1-dehydrogenase [Sphaerisporangium krabiense]